MRDYFRKFVVFAAAVSIVCAAGEISQATEVAGSAVPSADLREIFLEKCSRCHEPERSYSVINDYRAWVLTVARMSIKDRHWIAPEDVKHIIAYHGSYRAEGVALFDERCGECHTREKLGSLGKSAGQWRTWIRFMAQRHGREVTDEECELLLCSLTEAA